MLVVLSAVMTAAIFTGLQVRMTAANQTTNQAKTEQQKYNARRYQSRIKKYRESLPWYSKRGSEIQQWNEREESLWI